MIYYRKNEEGEKKPNSNNYFEIDVQWEKICVLLFLLISLGFLTGCSLLNSRIDAKIASISISPKNSTFGTGSHQSFVVVKNDENGVEVGDIEKPSLTVTGDIGIINEYDQFYATKVGTGTIIAIYNNLCDTAEVEVVPGSTCQIYFGEFESVFRTDDPLNEVFSYFKAMKTINASKLRMFVELNNNPDSISIKTDVFVSSTSYDPSTTDINTAAESANWTKVGFNIDIVSLFGNTDGWKEIPINSYSFAANNWYLIKFVQTVSKNNNAKSDFYQCFSANIDDFANSGSYSLALDYCMCNDFKTVYIDLK